MEGVTAPTLFEAGRPGVLEVAPRRDRRKKQGGPPLVPPEDADGGGGGGGDGEDGSFRRSGTDEVGRFALVLALAGITTLFAVLIAVWLFLRRPAPDWRAGDAHAPDALWLSTACLVA